MKPLRIAFVSSHPSLWRFRRDASFVYRCENPALALSYLGHRVSLLHLTALLVRRDFDIVVFLRPVGGRIFDYVTSRLRARGVTMIGDVDDLIFDPESASFRPSVRNQTGDEIKTRNKFVAHRDALSKLDKVVVSTDELADRYLAQHPKAEIAVIPNAGHRSWFSIQPVASTTERNISYFSGTRTHDRDFASIVPALERLLDRHPDLKLRIVGPLSVALGHPQVIRIPKVPFQEYVQLVRTSYVNIAPLEDTPFNQCKSALKAVEAGAMNVPTVASSVGEYSRVDVEGVLHANTVDEWESQLEFAIDPINHKKLSQGLRERMLKFSDIDNLVVEYLNFVKKTF